ncbi:ribonuclease H-like domain-containing protein, partial [Tanacetum coccineum]
MEGRLCRDCMMVVKEIRSWNGGLSKTLMMKENRMKKVMVVLEDIGRRIKDIEKKVNLKFSFPPGGGPILPGGPKYIGGRGMTSNSKVGLGYEIQSNNEVLSYEEEMNRTVFKCTKEDFLNKPLYSRFSKTDSFKGVPHPLTGTKTPNTTTEIDESLYFMVSFGNPSEHSSESESESISVRIEMSTSKSVTTNEKDHPLKNMEDRGIFDSGCSGHMTGNKDHLDDFEECKGGSVTFGEAEYVAAASCCGQVLWIQNQMLDYGFNFMNTKIHIDNESTICIVKNPVYHSKTKHIEIRHHFIRDSYEKKLIRVEKIHTDFNVADLLTKAFDGPSGPVSSARGQREGKAPMIVEETQATKKTKEQIQQEEDSLENPEVANSRGEEMPNNDDEASYHEDASDNDTANNKPKQQQQQQIPTTTTISNIKLPILKKEEYDIWAMEMEHYLEYIDNDVRKVIQNGNSKKRISTRKDGVVRVLPPVSAADIHAVKKERKARTILIMAIPKEHLRKFHGIDDAKEIWEAIRTRFGGIANSKKMQKAVLKQQFEAFTISSSEGLEKRYDRFQQLLSYKTSNNKVKSGHTGPYSTYTSSTSSNNTLEREVLAGFVDEIIYSLFAKQSEDLDLLREDLEQINDVDIEEMDINWQIAMIVIRMKKFYKKTGRRVRIDGNKPVGFDKKKLECFKCHNTGHFARECTSKGTNDGKKEDLFFIKIKELERKSRIRTLKTLCDEQMNQLGEQEAKILAYTLAVKKLEAQIVTFQKQQLSLNEQLTFQANEIYAKDEKLKRYRRIGMKAVKEKEQLKKTVDSWKDSSKNLWKLIDSGMSSTSKVGLGYEIKSNNEVLSYEEEMNRSVFKCTAEDYINKPLYSRFTKTNSFKGVPHPLTGDYTPKPQEEIDDSLYVYGKKGPQKPEISDSDDNSTEHSTCQSNDSEGSCGNTSEHSSESESESISVTNEMSTSKSVITNEKVV